MDIEGHFISSLCGEPKSAWLPPCDAPAVVNPTVPGDHPMEHQLWWDQQCRATTIWSEMGSNVITCNYNYM